MRKFRSTKRNKKIKLEKSSARKKRVKKYFNTENINKAKLRHYKPKQNLENGLVTAKAISAVTTVNISLKKNKMNDYSKIIAIVSVFAITVIAVTSVIFYIMPAQDEYIDYSEYLEESEIEISGEDDKSLNELSLTKDEYNHLNLGTTFGTTSYETNDINNKIIGFKPENSGLYSLTPSDDIWVLVHYYPDISTFKGFESYSYAINLTKDTPYYNFPVTEDVALELYCKNTPYCTIKFDEQLAYETYEKGKYGQFIIGRSISEEEIKEKHLDIYYTLMENMETNKFEVNKIYEYDEDQYSLDNASIIIDY